MTEPDFFAIFRDVFASRPPKKSASRRSARACLVRHKRHALWRESDGTQITSRRNRIFSPKNSFIDVLLQPFMPQKPHQHWAWRIESEKMIQYMRELVAQAIVLDQEHFVHIDSWYFLPSKIDQHAIFDLQRMIRFLLLLQCHQKRAVGR